jgi:hypothetical protein
MSHSINLTAVRLLRLAREGAIALGIAVLAPFLVHLLPSWDDSPLGSHLLPIFYAPLGALMMGRMGLALGVGLLAPWLNHVLTGHPVIPMAVLLCLQLALFVPAGALLARRGAPAWSIGPLAYLVALALSALLGTVLIASGNAFPVDLTRVPGSVFRSLPGLAVLALVGWWCARQRPHAA